MKIRAAVIAVGLAVLALASGCSSSDPGADLTVFAASSLKNTFTELGDRFEEEHPGSTIEFNFAGSSDLVTQLTNGAQADVFAAADTKNMDKAAEASLIERQPTNFASNTLAIVTAPGNPKRINSLADLTRPELLVVVCAPQVPCGSATQKVQTAADVDIRPVSEEQNVSDVLNKVTSGEADAGLVYITDATAAGDNVAIVEFPESKDAVNTYPIALLTTAGNKKAARDFIDLVTGVVGQEVLERAGFAKP